MEHARAYPVSNISHNLPAALAGSSYTCLSCELQFPKALGLFWFCAITLCSCCFKPD